MGMYLMKSVVKQYLYFFLLLYCIMLQAGTLVISKYIGVGAETFSFQMSLILFSSMIILTVMQAVTWQFVLKKIDLSIAYPLTSIIYLFIFLSGIIFFDEKWNYIHIGGLLLILTGTVLLCKGSVRQCM